MAEVRLGADLADALERAAVRVGNQDLAWAVIAIRIQRETGGNLAETWRPRWRRSASADRLRRHVRALSAEGRLSAYILLGLPFAIGALDVPAPARLSQRRSGPHRSGLMLLVGAGLLMVLGAFWMSPLDQGRGVTMLLVIGFGARVLAVVAVVVALTAGRPERAVARTIKTADRGYRRRRRRRPPPVRGGPAALPRPALRAGPGAGPRRRCPPGCPGGSTRPATRPG